MDENEIKAQQTTKMIIILILVVVVIIFGSKILNVILEALGLKKGEEEKKKDAEIEAQEKTAIDFFNPNYYRIVPEGYKNMGRDVIPYFKAKDVAKQIHDAIGYIYDTPEQIVAAFKKARYKSDVSKISQAFAELYKIDLLAYLADKLDKDAQRTQWLSILKELNKLPMGFTK